MSRDANEQLFTAYLDDLRRRGLFARFFTEDVVWTTVETGEQIRGRQAVSNYIKALHTVVFDARPEISSWGVTEGHAFVEAELVGVHTGQFGSVAASGAHVRVPYCVVYDLTDEGISALRFYMAYEILMAQVRAGSVA